jgi:pyruvate dehydrogenase E2 component (dihydrolipoamide acetyltransferase)
MATEVILPKFGFTQEESQIVEWFVKEGDTVAAGDPLLEVTTDKVNMEVEAPKTGILGGIRAAAGDTVPVTRIIAYILEPGEKAPPVDSVPAVTPAASPVMTETTPAAPHLVSGATPVAARMAAASGVDPTGIPGTGPGGRVMRKDVERFLDEKPDRELAGHDGKVRATPAARRVARETGVDLAAVSGSGPRGRVQSQDVVTAVAPPAPPTLPDVAAEEPVRVPFSTMRRTIARTLQRSIQEAPHISFQADIDMTAIQVLLARANERRPVDAEKVTLTAVLARAVAWTLAHHPTLNSHMGEDELILWPVAHIGIAVALDDGLIVPVVKDAGSKGLARLSDEITDLVRRAGRANCSPTNWPAALLPFPIWECSALTDLRLSFIRRK